MKLAKKTICYLLTFCLAVAMIFPFTEEGFAAETAAKIGDVEYESLQSAIDNAASDDVIVLQKDITDERIGGDRDDKKILIGNEKTVNIDLNDYAITESEGAFAIEVQQGSILRLENQGEIGTGGEVKNTASEGKAFGGEGVAEAMSGFILNTKEDGKTVQVLKQFTVTTSIKNGTITGPDTVTRGERAEYTITPSTGYKITGIKVDGAVKTVTNSGLGQTIALKNIQKDTDISVACAIRTFKITSSVSTTPSVFTGGTITASATVNYGANKTFTIKPKTGFKVKAVYIDGKNKGAIKTYTFKSVTAKHTIKAVFEKNALFIMLDAGHIGLYNRYPGTYGGKYYYESQMAWKLQNYLKTELLKYNKVKVGTTRTGMYQSMDVYTRGVKAKGYDLFLSLHSNASSSTSTDYPLVIKQYKANTAESSLAGKLSTTIRNTMKTKQSAKVWTKTYKNSGKVYDWYGVLRGAKAVGCNGYILEHSFHTNRSKAKWLYSNSNLKKMAKAEAAAIAKHYGLKKKTTATTTTTTAKTTFSPYKVKITASVLNVRSGASTGYKKVGTLKKGKVYTVVKKSANGKWGKLSCKNGGWISLNYTKKTTSSSAIKAYKVKNTLSSLNVRSGPGTSYKVVGKIKNKTKYYIITKESTSGKWGKLSGANKWICLSYVNRYY